MCLGWLDEWLSTYWAYEVFYSKDTGSANGLYRLRRLHRRMSDPVLPNLSSCEDVFRKRQFTLGMEE